MNHVNEKAQSAESASLLTGGYSMAPLHHHLNLQVIQQCQHEHAGNLFTFEEKQETKMLK
jgi:hypothetical protein